MAPWAGAYWLRRAAVLTLLLLAGLAAIRSAAVRQWSEEQPERALTFWPGHPAAAMSSALAEIGRAAAMGRTPDAATLDRVTAAARGAPLAAEPLLIAGTEALSRGDSVRAEDLLTEARRRDPRAVAPRLLLANLYLRRQRIDDGLKELAALSRLAPDGPGPIVEAIIAYARQPGTEEPLRTLLSERPDLRDPVLTGMAADPKLADQVLRLAGPAMQEGRWQAVLVDALVRDGQFARARQLWSRFTGDSTPVGGLVDPAFARTESALPPFDWSFPGQGGVAEPRGPGLHVLSYGREEGVLASQLMTLPSRRYRLSFRLRQSGDIGSLAWVLVCVPDGRELGRAPVGGSAGRSEAALQVPPACPAQRLELRAQPTVGERTSETTIDSLSLERLAK